ncbi:MAG: hypothetical protein ABF289_01105 [Clostridiales bacterium]
MDRVENRYAWSRIRKRGKIQYILIYWVLGWGIPVALISSVISEFFSYGFYLSMFLKKEFYFRSLGISVLFVIVGIFIGMRIWVKEEKIWRKNYQSSNNKNDIF